MICYICNGHGIMQDMSTFTSKGGPNLIYKDGILHKVLTSGGYVETSDSTQAP